MFKKLSSLAFASVILISGCGWKYRTDLAKIDLGADKTTVISMLGEPEAVRGANINGLGQSIQVWEYQLTDKSEVRKWRTMCILGSTVLVWVFWGISCSTNTGMAPDVEDYWLVFIDGKLGQWGKAGDWQEKEIKEYRLNTNPGPSL